MQKLPQIKAAYDWMIQEYDTKIGEATASTDMRSVQRLENFRDSLERGVFVLMFGQFEIDVTDRFRVERENRMRNPDWRIRRGWDTPSLGVKSVPFLSKLALMMDRTGKHYRKIELSYHRRNHCAHGGTSEPVGSIDQFFKDLYEWQAELRRHSSLAS